MKCTATVFQRSDQGGLTWQTVGLGALDLAQTGRNAIKVEEGLLTRLRAALDLLEPAELPRLRAVPGARIERVQVELWVSTGDKRVRRALQIPLVLQPLLGRSKERLFAAFHPLRAGDWFVHDPALVLADQAQAWLSRAWPLLEVRDLDVLKCGKSESLRLLSFKFDPPSVLDGLPKEKRGPFDDLAVERTKQPKRTRRSRGDETLRKVGLNATDDLLAGGLRPGVPRSPYREQLLSLLGGEHKTPVLLVGPPGCGKSALITRLVADLAEADGYALHQDRDKLHQVWRIAGRQIIAGMSFVGDWEQRSLKLLAEARGMRRILVVDDLHAWGRIGRTRQSDTNLALAFQGPLQRGEVALLGECTPEQLQRLEDDAPSFAALFTQMRVAPTGRDETLRLLFREARALEEQRRVAFDPLVFAPLLELSAALSPGGTFPGQALELLREVSRSVPAAAAAGAEPVLGPAEVREVLARRTGLPLALLEPGAHLDPAEVAGALERQVMGQPEAVEAVVDLVLRIRTGLVDPRRPYGVYLFSGPTGTGKTELAKALAAWLYGSEARLVRFDLGEFSGPDAAARLVGDAFSPEGLLTRAVHGQPFCVVLLDEIEKAHPSVLHLLLQLFDDGRLSDAAGTTVDFTHAVIVMTSNLGAQPRAPIGLGEPDAAQASLEAGKAVRAHFSPELFNRIDRVVRFRPLTEEVAGRIAEKELARLAARRGLSARNVFVAYDEAVQAGIAARAFDPASGARSLKRWLEDEVGGLFVDALAEGSRAPWQRFRLYQQEGRILLSREALQAAPQVEGEHALREWEALPTAALRARLAQERAAAGAREEEGALEPLEQQAAEELARVRGGQAQEGDAPHDLEQVRDALAPMRSARADEAEARLEREELRELELTRREEVVHPHQGGVQTVRQFRSSSIRTPGQVLAREDLLDALADAAFLRRCAPLAGEPSAHAVLLELTRIGMGQGAGRFAQSGGQLLAWLAGAYAGAGFEVSLQTARLFSREEVPFTGAPPPGAAQVLLQLSGPFARFALSCEEGCHVWRSLARLPEIVRVRVLPAAPGADHGQAPPEAAAQLTPVVRVYHFEPPARPGERALLELEDNALGHLATLRVRSPAEALPGLWRLHKSRR